MDNFDAERFHLNTHLPRKLLEGGLADVVDAIEGHWDPRRNRANIDDGALGSKNHGTEGLGDLQDAPDVDVENSSGGSKICVK